MATAILPPGCAYMPISPPPPGKACNFAHPESRASDVYIAVAICIPVIFLFVTFRILAILTLKKRKAWDDMTCLLGTLAGLVFIIITTIAVSGSAYAKHQWDITLEDFTKVQLLLSLLVSAVYGPFIWLIKLSLFVLYLEIFSILRWLRYLAYGGIIFTGLFYLSTMIVFIVLCGPKDGNTQLSYITALASPQCAKSHTIVTLTGALNVISDLYLIILPLPALWSLQLPRRRKIGVSAMFLTGSIALGASILGLYYRVYLSQHTDNTWNTIPTWITGFVEMTAGIVVCCMPSTAAVLMQFGKPITSYLSSHIPFMSSSTKHERIVEDSNNSAKPPIFAGGSHATSNEIRVSGRPGSDRSESSLELNLLRGSDSRTNIRKTTELDVTSYKLRGPAGI